MTQLTNRGLDCSSDAFHELFTRLAWDDELRARVKEEPVRTLAAFGVHLDEVPAVEDIELPPKEHFRQLLAGMPRPEASSAQPDGVFAAADQGGIFAASQQEGVFAAADQGGIFAASQQEGVFAAA
ncbi:MAG: hypothetical protein MI919_18915, partial [Holophagales bacterium]|nr:hypothetical protein [Holophagales bacterium]